MKVAILLPSVRGGGAEFVGAEWQIGLRDLGHDVDIIVTHERPAKLSNANTTALRATSFLPRVLQLRRVIKRQKYDALISLMPHWNVLAILSTRLLSRPIRVIVSAHSLEAGMVRTHGLSFFVETALAKILYPYANALLAVSHPVGAEIRDGYHILRRRLWVIPNPVLNRRPPAGVTSFSRPEDASVSLVFAGRLVKQKNPESLLLCAQMLETKHGLKTRVEFFGSGSEKENLGKIASSLGITATFHGWSSKWADLCGPDAILLLPSLVEGFGNVLIEAAAAGIPSVASSRALGVADAIVPGMTGILSPSDDIADLCRAVIQARELVDVDMSKWLAQFSRQNSAHILDQVLHDEFIGRGNG